MIAWCEFMGCIQLQRIRCCFFGNLVNFTNSIANNIVNDNIYLQATTVHKRNSQNDEENMD